MLAIQLRLECKLELSRDGVEAGFSRTNNYTQSWHSAFNKMLIKYPLIYSFIIAWFILANFLL